MSVAAEFFSKEWAENVRDALQAGPSAETRDTALQEYWDFFDLVRSMYTGSWALGVRDLPRELGGGPSYLFVNWEGGNVTDCRIIGPDDPLEATYILAGSYAHWKGLLEGYDARRAVMYRHILLEEGDLLEFFTTVYFFVESLAVVGRVPTSFPAKVSASS